MSNVIEITWGDENTLYVDATAYDSNFGMKLKLKEDFTDSLERG